MSDQGGKRAQREALRALEKSAPGDAGPPTDDALARYLRLQAAGSRKARPVKTTQKSPTTESG